MTIPMKELTPARRKLLFDLQARSRAYRETYQPLRWALDRLLVCAEADLYRLTDAGQEALREAETDPALKLARAVIARRRSLILCRQVSDTEEATQRGGGYLYFTEPDHKPFPPAGGRLLIDKGEVIPMDDGLFSGMSQTFKVPEVAAE